MKTLYKFELHGSEPAALFSCLNKKPYSLFLDSADQSHVLGCSSFIAFDPFETIEARNGNVEIRSKSGSRATKGNPFAVVKERLKAWDYKPESDKDLPPFQGGAAGFFGYDLVRGIEKLPSKPSSSDLPHMAVGLYDQLIAFDHRSDRAWFITICEDQEDATQRYNALQALVDKAPVPDDIYDPRTVQWQAEFTRTEYEQAVQRVIDYIYAGDIFQANLSQRFSASLPKDFAPFTHYRHLRTINPAPFAGYMNFGDLILSSASPERFLYVEDRGVETRPIKGTRPRFNDPEKDTCSRQELAASEKDRAENTMIVDLMRNDLSKVCEDNSIHVPQLCQLESFASVHHLVSTVNGKLKDDNHSLDLLEACFPGGSITGAPKVRAMEIINELETERRGPYCGSMGYIGFDGTMDTNILIRTLVYQGQTVRFNVGGGIVAASSPAAEYEETLDKAQGLFNSFAAPCAGKQFG